MGGWGGIGKVRLVRARPPCPDGLLGVAACPAFKGRGRSRTRPVTLADALWAQRPVREASTLGPAERLLSHNLTSVVPPQTQLPFPGTPRAPGPPGRALHVQRGQSCRQATFVPDPVHGHPPTKRGGPAASGTPVSEVTGRGRVSRGRGIATACPGLHVHCLI